MRMRILPSLAALLLGVAAALLVACGDDGRIPASDASRVTNALDDVAADFRAGNCQAAQQAVVRARGALLNLPDSVDARLRARLRSGVSKLAEDVPAACGRSQSQTQPAEPTQTDKTDTETSTTDTSTTDTETQPTDSTGTGTGGTPTGTTPGPTTGTTTGGTDTQTGGTPPDGGTTP
ncbi:MAG TPA: hypothetical protein VF257_16315 [Solirubrobacteraceae bacterium]